jgi:hypothetical protein
MEIQEMRGLVFSNFRSVLERSHNVAGRRDDQRMI